NGGLDTRWPFSRTSIARSRPQFSLVRKYSNGSGSCAGGATRACSSASSGTIHGETEVANDFPRNGPSGWYSQAWMSRADQSLTRHTPNTCCSKSEVDTCVPKVDGVPTTKPTSASMSSRCDGPNDGSAAFRGLRWPDGRTTG